MNKVYIVTGMTGWYDDIFVWNVCVCSKEEDAQIRVLRLNNWCRDTDCHYLNNRDIGFDIPDSCPLDSNFYCEYPGVMYNYEKCDYE